MYKLGFFLSEQYDPNRVLLSNDLGRFVFLSPEAFGSLRDLTLEPTSQEYALLRDNGFIYEGSREDYIAEWSESLATAKSCLLTSTQLFILALTTACNQHCTYCQAGRLEKAFSMSVDTSKKAIDMAFQSPATILTIEFQGGEPTLNPEVLRFAVPYAKQVAEEQGKQVQFAIVSNLTAVDLPLMEWLILEGVSISSSLDGPQSLHDLNRPLSTDASSYANWQAGLAKCRSLYAEYGTPNEVGAIQTTTRASLQHPHDIVAAYIENGYHTLYVRPLTPLGCAADEWEHIGYSAEEYLEFYTAILDELIECCKQGYQIVETTASLYLARILNHESVGHTELRSPCGAAVEQMAINYDGKVYTCDEGRMLANMGDDTFCLGNVDQTYEQLVTSPAAHATCTASCLESLPLCSRCAYSPFCSVCPVVNYGCEHDLVSHDPNGYKCAISKGILRYLLDRVYSATPEELEILKRWAE